MCGQDSGKETPLHRAARVGQTAAVKVLLSLGADTSIKNKKGKTAEDVASGDVRSELKTDTESDKGKGSMFKSQKNVLKELKGRPRIKYYYFVTTLLHKIKMNWFEHEQYGHSIVTFEFEIYLNIANIHPQFVTFQP